ncbi:MAG: universal stress protein [Algibacter sp.]
MKNNKYKILVLSDLKESSENLFESSLSLAKRVHGDIEFFHVKRPSDVVDKENQLNAIRNIKEGYKLADKQLKSLIGSVSGDYNVNYNIAFGNVKNEIEKHIKTSQPDIIVLGKRKSKSLGFIGDNITRFILKNYNVTIFIASNKDTLKSNKMLSLGVLNDFEKSSSFADKLVETSDIPLKSFKIRDDSSLIKNEAITSKQKDVIEYVFEKQSDTIKNISNYLHKSSIDLFCVNRSNIKNGTRIKKSEIESMINTFNGPLLITG